MGGFVEHLHDGTHFNHVVEHIGVEMLAQAGLAPRDKKICLGGEKTDAPAVIETTAVETARYILPLASEIADSILKQTSVSIEEKIAEEKTIAADYELGPSERTIVEAATRRGKTVTGIIGVPSDRDDSIIEEAGRIAARGFHKVVIKEDKDTRGRASGEVARLLCETVTKAAPDRSCEIVLDEIEAFENALWEMSESDVVVLFYDKLEFVLEILDNYQAAPVAGFDQIAVY